MEQNTKVSVFIFYKRNEDKCLSSEALLISLEKLILFKILIDNISNVKITNNVIKKVKRCIFHVMQKGMHVALTLILKCTQYIAIRNKPTLWLDWKHPRMHPRSNPRGKTCAEIPHTNLLWILYFNSLRTYTDYVFMGFAAISIKFRFDK